MAMLIKIRFMQSVWSMDERLGFQKSEIGIVLMLLNFDAGKDSGFWESQENKATRTDGSSQIKAQILQARIVLLLALWKRFYC